MKVLHILDSLNRGGAEMLALDICRNAQRAGLDLTFAATGGGDLEADFKDSGVDFIRMNRRLPLDLRVIARLRGIIKKRNIQIIHAYQAVEGIHAYCAALGTKTKIVLSFQGYFGDEKNRRTLRFLIPRVAANIAVSREFLRWLAEKESLDTSRNFHVIYNAVDEKRLAASGGNLKDELKLPPDALLFGMVGNFYAAERKDQMTVCRALPPVFARFPDAHCLFAGKVEPGAEAKFAECVEFCRAHGIGDRVHFLGMRSDVSDILSALDVFVLSTRHDSFGIAAAEAMLTGVPCVLSDIEPMLEVSNNGECAEIFATGCAEELTEKLTLLAENAERRRNLAARGQIWASENFTIEAHLENLKRLYESLF